MSESNHKIYEKPILDEVVFEARFPLKLTIEKYIGDFQETIENEFPIVEYRINPILISPQNKPAGNSITEEKIWIFKDKDQSKLVISQNKIAISSKKYHSWDSHNKDKGFFSFIQEILSFFQKIYNISHFNRLGLRYINKYSYKKENLSSKTFSFLFHPLFDISSFPLEILSENKILIQKSFKDNQKLTIQSLFQFKEDFSDYILDFDAYKEHISFSEIIDELDKLHTIIIEAFESLITNELRTEMKPFA